MGMKESEVTEVITFWDTGSYLTLLRDDVLPVSNDTYTSMDALLEALW